MPEPRTHYQILGILPTATPEEIAQAYRRLARTYHPDLQPPDLRVWANECMQAINAAYEVLSDPRLKARYDAMMYSPPIMSRVEHVATDSDVPTYHIWLTDRAARRILDVLLIAGVTIFALSRLPSPTVPAIDVDPSYGYLPALGFCALLIARLSRTPQGIAVTALGFYIIVGCSILLPLTSVTNQASSFGQLKVAVMIVIWFVACMIASIIVIRHFKIVRP